MLHAFNPGGGLHHAMPDRAAGFCVYNDVAAAIATLLDDEPRRRRMSEAALATVSGPRGRNVEGMVAGFLDAIDFAAARHGKSRH